MRPVAAVYEYNWMMDRGARCWWRFFFSPAYWSDATTSNISDTILFFSDNNNNIKTTTTTQKRQKLTHMQIVLVVEYLDCSCRNEKRSIRNFYVSSNIFASFLSQTSKIVHSSLHLSTCLARFTSRDFICVVCRLSFERSVPFILVLRR